MDAIIEPISDPRRFLGAPLLSPPFASRLRIAQPAHEIRVHEVDDLRHRVQDVAHHEQRLGIRMLHLPVRVPEPELLLFRCFLAHRIELSLCGAAFRVFVPARTTLQPLGYFRFLLKVQQV
ncbi:MAG: hypothetical protein V2A74_09305, partial [bacterium]